LNATFLSIQDFTDAEKLKAQGTLKVAWRIINLDKDIQGKFQLFDFLGGGALPVAIQVLCFVHRVNLPLDDDGSAGSQFFWIYTGEHDSCSS